MGETGPIVLFRIRVEKDFYVNPGTRWEDLIKKRIRKYSAGIRNGKKRQNGQRRIGCKIGRPEENKKI